MENNKQNATLFVYQWVDENVVPDDTGKLSDMLIAYGNKLNIPDVINRRELLIDFCQSVQCYDIQQGTKGIKEGVDDYLKSINSL